MSSQGRLRVLQWLTVLVPAVCAGLYETVRHSLLAAQLPTGLGTLLAVAVVLAISFVFARVAFGLIRRMEARLRERNRQLEALSLQVQRLAVIEERDRLAREMHDGIAQVLAFLLVRLDTIEGLIERDRPAAAVEEVRRLRASGEGAYADVREAIAGLRVRPQAGAAGLGAALHEYAAQFGARNGVEVEVTATAVEGPDQGDLGAAAELQLLRIAQEALANVRKHSRATRVWLRLWRAPDGWHLDVRDDGRGFDPAAPLPPGRQHFGLPIMRERAESLGGTLSVSSSPGAGTTVHALVPLAAARPTPMASRRRSPPGALETPKMEEESQRPAPVDVQRVLLVDDHALFREALAGLLAYEEDFEIVGQAPDGERALVLARELMPDLVLMDIDMPGPDGIAVARRLTRELPYVKVVMLTVHDEDDKLFEAVKAGAHGYLVKSIRSREMLDLLRGMARGEAPISRAMATRILQEFARTAPSASGGAGPGPAEPEATLTPRERDVLELVARRYSNKEIASALVITEYTVKNHLRNILSKLHLRSRGEAARYATARGLLDQPAPP